MARGPETAGVTASPGIPAVPAPAICLLGSHEPGYPRNRSVKEAMQTAGFRVLFAHSQAPFPWRHVILAWRACKILRREPCVEWIWVTEGGHRLVPWVKLLARALGRKVVFDPFLSRYNTRVEDRRLHKPGSFQALICRWQDWSSTRAADLLVFDTEEHKDYFYRNYRLRQPCLILPVGVPETVFHQQDRLSLRDPYPAGAAFRVLFYGSYIPLQGAEWIVEAAALLKGETIRFTLVGDGQTFPATVARARALGLHNLDFVTPVPETDLPAYLAHADLCLGIFGNTAKAANVVPNKVVQASAMGRPILTRDSPAIRRYFRDGVSLALTAPGDARALADALLRLRAQPALLDSLGGEARKVFEAGFSVTALSRILKDTLGPPADR
ncbi:MAG: glycosyltransferase [Fibrobacteria bacterium]